MNKIVYKVVIQYEGFETVLASPFAPKWSERLYQVGVTTYPVSRTKLFAFTSLDDAKSYAEIYCNAKVFKAKATNVVKNGWLFNAIYDPIELYDVFIKHEMGTNTNYKSSVVCDSITLLEEVK